MDFSMDFFGCFESVSLKYIKKLTKKRPTGKICTKVNSDCGLTAESLETFAKIISVTSISGLLVKRI